MANTNISDIIVPEVFQQYMIRETAERARIFQSGLLVSDGSLSSFLAGGGYSVKLPRWDDLWNTATSAPSDNASSDDEASDATPLAITANNDLAIRQNRNQGWSSSDLTAALAGDDPLAMVVARVATFWANSLERTFVSTLKGIVAESVAPTASSTSNADDLVHTAAAGVTPEDIIDAAATMGDADDRLSAIIMHSKIYASLAKQNLIDFIPDSEGRSRFPTYLNYTVIRDDDCPVATGVYDTYLIARDAFAWGEGSARVPVETDRHPRGGDGGGVEELWTRREFVMHPRGYSCIVADAASGASPIDSVLAVATSWQRNALERKQIGFACLKSTV